MSTPLPIKHDLAFFDPKHTEAIRTCLNLHTPSLPPSAQELLERIAEHHRRGVSWRREGLELSPELFALVSADLVGSRGCDDYHLSLRGLLWLRSRGVDVSRPTPPQTKQPSLFGGDQ